MCHVFDLLYQFAFTSHLSLFSHESVIQYLQPKVLPLEWEARALGIQQHHISSLSCSGKLTLMILDIFSAQQTSAITNSQFLHCSSFCAHWSGLTSWSLPRELTTLSSICLLSQCSELAPGFCFQLLSYFSLVTKQAQHSFNYTLFGFLHNILVWNTVVFLCGGRS